MNVAFIGDSIRMNAEPFVRMYLPDTIGVHSPAENCESSHRVAASISTWVPATGIDVVHINCGLHDIRYDPGLDRPVSSLDQYRANLHAIFSYLAGTGAIVIWATSTPVDEDRHNRNKLSRRYQADLIEYNRISVELAYAFGFRIHDLYERLSQASIDTLLLPDGVHFNRAGNELIGRHIVDAIQGSLER